MKRFSEIIDEHLVPEGSFAELPLVHTTTERPLFDIIVDEQIKYPKLCHIYNENLVYFFYGKAAYYTSEELGSFTNNPPVSILYDLNNLKDENIKRVLPFDSGGYPRYGITNYDKEHFTHSQPTKDTCKKILHFLFQDVTNYFRNNASVKNLNEKKSNCWPLNELIKLYTKRIPLADIKTGQQVYSIEVQYENKVAFLPSKLILPYTFILNEIIDINSLKKNIPGLEIIFYGEDEIIKNSGVPLEGYKYHELMINAIKATLN